MRSAAEQGLAQRHRGLGTFSQQAATPQLRGDVAGEAFEVGRTDGGGDVEPVDAGGLLVFDQLVHHLLRVADDGRAAPSDRDELGHFAHRPCPVRVFGEEPQGGLVGLGGNISDVVVLIDSGQVNASPPTKEGER